MWKRLLPEETLEVGDREIRSLAKRYIFSGGLIKNAVLTGLNLARSRGADLSLEILEDSCRIQADSLIERSERTTVFRPVLKMGDFPILLELGFGQTRPLDQEKSILILKNIFPGR